jgi:two-component system nitrate/nitrite response regulator NarL
MKPASPRSLPLRVLLVDDHAAVRDRVKTALSADTRLLVVGEAATGAEGLKLAVELAPDVVLLESRLPDQRGDDVCRQLNASKSAPVVLILTSSGGGRSVLAYRAAGADGYLLKDFVQLDLAHTVVQTVLMGYSLWPTTPIRREHISPAEIARRIARLSPRDRRMLELLAAGRTSREVAAEMKLRAATVYIRTRAIINTLRDGH